MPKGGTPQPKPYSRPKRLLRRVVWLLFLCVAAAGLLRAYSSAMTYNRYRGAAAAQQPSARGAGGGAGGGTGGGAGGGAGGAGDPARARKALRASAAAAAATGAAAASARARIGGRLLANVATQYRAAAHRVVEVTRDARYAAMTPAQASAALWDKQREPGGFLENPKTVIQALLQVLRGAWLAAGTLLPTGARAAEAREWRAKIAALHRALLLDSLRWARMDLGGQICERDDWFAMLASPRGRKEVGSSRDPRFWKMLATWQRVDEAVNSAAFDAMLAAAAAADGELLLQPVPEGSRFERNGYAFKVRQPPAVGATTVPYGGGGSGPLLSLPLVGMGGNAEPDAVQLQVVGMALQLGYRLFDTAQLYQSQIGVGQALKAAMEKGEVARGDFTLMSKLGGEQNYKDLGEHTRASFFKNLKRIGLKYFDIYMVHHMVDMETYRKTWLELEKLVDEGYIKALGVSSIGVDVLDTVMGYARHKPVIYQMYFNVFHSGPMCTPTEALVTVRHIYNNYPAMAIVAFTTLYNWPMEVTPLPDLIVKHAIAKRIGRSPAQVLLRHAVQSGIAVIPRSKSKGHALGNLQVTSFALADEDMALLNGLGWLAQWCAPQFAHDALGLAPLVRQTNELGMCAYNFTFQSLDNLARNPVGCDPHLSSEAGPKPGSEEAAACQRHDWDPNRLYDEDAAELKEAAT